MKILIFAIGSRGDVQPFVALGRAARAAGHEVVLSAPKNFTSFVEAAGLTAAPLPTDIQALLEEPEIKAAMTSLTGRLKAFRWATELMNEQLSAVWQIGLDVEPDVIIHHFKAPIAPYLARRLGAVSIPVLLQPAFATTGEFPPSILFARSLGHTGNRIAHRTLRMLTRMGTNVMLKKWRNVSGTEIGPRLDMTRGYGSGIARLHAYSPSLIPRPKDWPDAEVQPGYFFTAPEDFAPPADLAAFLEAGETPIYVGFGSMPGIDHTRTTEALVGALRQTGLRAVVATGWGGIADVATDRQLFVLDAIPHSWLFPRVAAVVHHGGSGTTHEGLRWGRPSVVCPLFADQPFFGARVAALGAGPPPIAQKRLTADRLSRALDTALNDTVAQRASALGAALREEDGVGRSIERVERIAAPGLVP